MTLPTDFGRLWDFINNKSTALNFTGDFKFFSNLVYQREPFVMYHQKHKYDSIIRMFVVTFLDGEQKNQLRFNSIY